MPAYVTVEKLTKRYGELVAVDNLSFTVGENEIFGFLGPNGAGKTTTLNVISTLSDFDRGEVSIAGYSLARDEFKIKGLLGLVPQEIALYRNLTAAENVALFASLYGLRGKALKKAVADALEFVGLADERKKYAGKLSGGMQRRLNIACGIAHRPKLIIMDEPTVGVDARSRDSILHSIQALRSEGATIIYTSHYMPEVQKIADRIAIIDRGRLAAIGTEKELLGFVTDRKSLTIGIGAAGGPSGAGPGSHTDGLASGAFGAADTVGGAAWSSGAADTARLAEAASADIGALHHVKRSRYAPGSGELHIDVDLSLADISPILNILAGRGVPVRSFSEEAPNLETTFLALTGRELNDGEGACAAGGEGLGNNDFGGAAAQSRARGGERL